MKVSRARVAVQVLIHLLIVLHLAAYYWWGYRRMGQADIQAFFHDFLGSGLVSTGVILAAAAFLLTLVLGRVFCGWGCHFGAFQDLVEWALRKAGWRPEPVRTRILHLLPYALLVFTFILPSVERYWGGGGLAATAGAPAGFQLRLGAGGPPWANLPGLLVSAVTFLACGAGLLLFLGTRGFCRYVCPYGAVFRVLDRPAPFRIRRSGSCGNAGCAPGDPPGRTAPCTASCPMGVPVHQEVHLLGEVRDSDCVRCHRCVEACPRDALTASFRPLSSAGLTVLESAPALLRGPPEPRPRYTFSLGREVLVAAVAVVSFAAWDLVYAAHFLAAAMALGEGFLALLLLETIRRRDLGLRRLKLRAGGRWTFLGAALPAVFLLSLLGVLQAGAFKTLRYSADRAYLSTLASAGSAAAPPPPLQLASGGSAGELSRSADLYGRAIRCFPYDRLTVHRYALVLTALGDRRAVGVAEGLAERWPGDLDGRELLRRVRARFPAAAPPAVPGLPDSADPVDSVDNPSPPR
jgi:polyferredoxin